MRPSRRAAIVAVSIAALAVLLFVVRHPIVHTALQAGLSAATGYDVRIGGETLGTNHAVFRNVHVRKNGDPVLDADRIDVDYALRDIFPGGQHRFGFAAIAVQHPVLTITRHADGTLTFNRTGGTPAAPPEATKRAAAPLYFTARVRDGVIRLIDAAPLERDLAEQSIENVSIDASVKSDARTTATVTGALIGRRSAGTPVRRYPLAVRALIDAERGVAVNAIRAPELPLRGVLGFLLHSRALRFDDGVLDGVDIAFDGVAPRPGDDFIYRLGGGARLTGGRLAIAALAQPVRDARGSVVVTDSALAVPALDATLAGIPVHGRGVLYDLFSTPAARLGFSASGDVSAVRTLFAFSRTLPLRGGVRVETLLTSRLSEPLVRTWFAAPRIAYGRFPLDAISGVADYYQDAVTLGGVEGSFGAAAVDIGGRVLLDDAGDDTAFVLHASGPGASLPYTDALAPDSEVSGTALIAQQPEQGYTARGTVAVSGRTGGALAFAVDPRGTGEFGPFEFNRADGESVAGGFELQRPISQSAGWLHARGFRLAQVARHVPLPGVTIPALPPVSGVLDGDLAGGGTPDAFGLAGTLRARDVQVAGYHFGSGSVRLGGTLADIRLAGIRVDGPMGRFAGEGAYANDLFALEGRYDGALEQLRPFVAGIDAHGPVHGDVRATIAKDRIVVQSTGADLAGAQVRGIPLDRVAGTLIVEGKTLRVAAVDGSVGGGRVVAAEAGGGFLVSAPAVPVSALREAGLPLADGTLALFGRVDLRGGPRFDGAVALDDGRVNGYPISGGADVTFADGTARISTGVAALGSTYGTFSGAIGGIGRTAPAYDLAADVPIGDIREVRRTLHLPALLRTLEGSFSADVRVRGEGSRPRVAGAVTVPEGSYNGLDFSGVRADLAMSPSSVSARNGVVTVGGSHARVDGAVFVASRAFDVDVRSADANLADFDDFFDEGETLGGHGSVAVAFSSDSRSTRTTGRVALRSLRYRRFAFGDTNATWSQRGGAVDAALDVAGSHGALRANATVVPAGGGPLAAFRAATYHAHLAAQRVDLATWLPPFGITAPVLGQVSATGSVAGRWPRLGVAGDATLADGSLFGYTVVDARAHARGDGDRVALSNTTLDLGFARFDASGSFGLTTTQPLALAVHVQSPDIRAAQATLLPKGPRYDIAGALQAEARISGSIARPRASLGFELTGARYASLAIPRVLGSVAYDGRTINVADAEAQFAHGSAIVTGQLPFSLRPLRLDPAAPLSFAVALDKLDLTPFAPFVPGGHTKLSGTVDGRLAIEGVLDAPRVVGNVTLAGGTYVSDLDRAGVTKADATLAFSGTSVALQALNANVGGGTLTGGGRLDLPFPGVHTSNYAIALTAKGARLDTPFGRGTVDGPISVRSATGRPVVSGEVTLSNASIPILTIYRNAGGADSGSPAARAAAPRYDLGFDLTARAGRNVRIQASSPYIDLGATGTVVLTGSLGAPKLAGTLTATPGGVFSTYNRAFRVQRATVTFDPANGLLPYVALRAYAHVTNPDPDPTRNGVGSADITVSVDGPADELAAGQGSGIVFSSNPPYSQEQIVGLLLDASVFGAVNFGSQQNGTTLRGAPGESNPLLPPGVTPYQAGVINFNQEAFSILNGQLTQRFLAPIERAFTGPLGLTDFEITVDYGGGIGYQALKQIGRRDVYASFGQTLSYPVRTTGGFTARPDATTSVQFSYFTQNGNPAITNNANGTSAFASTTQRLNGFQPLSNRQGFTFSIVRKYR